MNLKKGLYETLYDNFGLLWNVFLVHHMLSIPIIIHNGMNSNTCN